MILPNDHYISVLNSNNKCIINNNYVYIKLKSLNNEQIVRDHCYPKQEINIILTLF